MSNRSIEKRCTKNEGTVDSGSGTHVPEHVPIKRISTPSNFPMTPEEHIDFAMRGMPKPLRDLQANYPNATWKTPPKPCRPEPPVPRRPALGPFEQAMHDVGDELYEILNVSGGKKKRLEQMQKLARKTQRVIAFMSDYFDQVEADIRQDLRENCPGVTEEDLLRSIDEAKRGTAGMMILQRHRERRLKREQLKKR